MVGFRSAKARPFAERKGDNRSARRLRPLPRSYHVSRAGDVQQERQFVSFAVDRPLARRLENAASPAPRRRVDRATVGLAALRSARRAGTDSNPDRRPAAEGTGARPGERADTAPAANVAT